MGRAMVLGFAAAGAEVVVVSRKLEACQKVVDEVKATTGHQALAIECHVGDWQQATRLVDRVYAELGGINVLVNNAGMSPPYDDVADVTEALFDKVMSVNLKGPFRLMTLVGKRMASSGGGSIINVTSHSASHPNETMIPYAAAKAALNNMTVAFAHAFGPSVRVNAIQPGAFLTDVSKAWPPDQIDGWAERYALHRCAEPDEIVGTALYLASDQAASYTTGAVVRVDGGNT